MVEFSVSPEKNKSLKETMNALGVNEKDIIEKFIRSSGRGGQKVNKTSSCVYIKHIPTGIEVKCMKNRSQSINRYLARKELLKKLETRTRGIESEVEKKRARVRKQKLKRRKRALSSLNPQPAQFIDKKE